MIICVQTDRIPAVVGKSRKKTKQRTKETDDWMNAPLSLSQIRVCGKRNLHKSYLAMNGNGCESKCLKVGLSNKEWKD